MHDNPLGNLFSAAGALWTIAVMNAAALFRAWPKIMERINERRRDAATERASDFERIREEVSRLSSRVEVLEQKLVERDDQLAAERAEKVQWMNRAVTAEATLQGYGEAKQIQAIEAAMKRLPRDDGNA